MRMRFSWLDAHSLILASCFFGIYDMPHARTRFGLWRNKGVVVSSDKRYE
jgi:hypothetical protein